MEKGKKARFQELLRADKLIVAPGAYDAFSARLVEQAGFPAVYISGAWAASSRLGVPDIGLATMSEVLDTAKNVVSATNIPVICDGDTGYGNALNVMRTVNEFERVGVAAIQIEDQIMSKKAGHIEGQKLITKEEMVKKIEAAKSARLSVSHSVPPNIQGHIFWYWKGSAFRFNGFPIEQGTVNQYRDISEGRSMYPLKTSL